MSNARRISGLLGSTALMAVAAPAVLAQESVAARPVNALGEADDTVLFEADTVSRASQSEPIIADGDVRAYFGARYLRADRLVYYPDTDVVIAEGDVSITDENLNTVFAGRVELTGDLRDGVAENFSALLAENARLAADSAVREQGARTRLRKAVYTSCSVCNDEGEGKIPTWRIKALRVTRDEERKVVRFHHAFFEIKGVPILYAPFIQAPDPSVERQSGFLTPLVGASDRLGFNFELPYYLALSNSVDATFFPKYTSNDGVLWQGEVRRRGDNSYHVWSGGIIDFDNFESEDPVTGRRDPDVPGVRWNVFARGYQDLSDNLRVGYDIERISDPTFLRRYDIRRRGDLRQELDTSRTNRLRSNAFVHWRDGSTEVRADSYLFQGLRSNDFSELTPYVLPLVNVRHEFQRKIAGGDLSANGNFVSLQRTSGADTRRLTASLDWEREYITRNGHRFEAFAQLRGDVYRYADLDEGTELTLTNVNDRDSAAPVTPDAVDDPTDFEARLAPTAGLEWSYPLYKQAGPARLFIEPRVQLVVSPPNLNDEDIINEDSQEVEFDYAGLFDFNKATGFDRFEDGQRVNLGVAASMDLSNGVRVDGEIGRQFRFQSTNAFTGTSGLGETKSDYVGSLNIKYRNVAGLENRFRIDADDGVIERAETLGYLNFWRLRTNLSYVRLLDDNPAFVVNPAAPEFIRREEINGRSTFKVTDHWSTGVAWREDLAGNRTIRQDYILAYRDDCALFELTYRRDFTRAGADLRPDNAILFRFTLSSLVD